MFLFSSSRSDWDALGSSSDEDKNEGSDFEVNGSSEKVGEENDSDEDVHSDDFEDDDEEDDFNPFGSGSDDDDPWAKRAKKKSAKKSNKKSKNSKKNGSSGKKSDPFAHLFGNKSKLDLTEKKNGGPVSSSMGKLPSLGVSPSPLNVRSQPQTSSNFAPPKENIDRACQMKAQVLKRIQDLGKILPANTLDQLIDELGGPENVAEMTGRKGRVVQVS